MCLGSPVWPEVPPDGERLDEPAPAEAEGAPAPARPPPADHSFMPERLAALEQRERALLACLSMRGLPSYVPQSMHAADIRNFAERSLRGLEALDARKGGA